MLSRIILLSFFGRSFTAAQIVLLASVVVGVILGLRRVRAIGGRHPIFALAILAGAGLIGARGHWVLVRWEYFRLAPHQILSFEGMHAGGALFATALCVPLVARILGLTAASLGDALAPAAFTAFGVARLGCFLNGCCYGTPCAWGWCLSFPSGSPVFEAHRRAGLIAFDAPGSLHVHPLQLYFATAAFMIALAGVLGSRHSQYSGQVAIWSVLAFSVTTLGLEFLRAPEGSQRLWWGVSQLKWVAAAGLVTSLVTAIAAHPRRPQDSRIKAEPS